MIGCWVTRCMQNDGPCCVRARAAVLIGRLRRSARFAHGRRRMSWLRPLAELRSPKFCWQSLCWLWCVWSVGLYGV